MSSDRTLNVIPDAVLSLLKQRWDQRPRPYEESVIARARALVDPMYFSYEPGHPATSSTILAGGILAFGEAQALSDHPAFAGLVKEHRGFVQVNEFAEYAVSEFCGEVYAAWDKLQARLETVRKGNPIKGQP